MGELQADSKGAHEAVTPTMSRFNVLAFAILGGTIASWSHHV